MNPAACGWVCSFRGSAPAVRSRAARRGALVFTRRVLRAATATSPSTPPRSYCTTKDTVAAVPMKPALKVQESAANDPTDDASSRVSPEAKDHGVIAASQT